MKKNLIPLVALIMAATISTTTIVTVSAETTKTTATVGTATKNNKLYTMNFTFNPKDYNGTIKNIAVVGEFLFYNSNLTGDTDKTGMNDLKTKYVPSQYKSGMKPVGGLYYQELKYDSVKKVYSTTLQLPAGVYGYHFTINSTLGEPATTPDKSWSNVMTSDGKLHGFTTMGDSIVDPKNKPKVATLTGGQMGSELYVGSSNECDWIPNSNKSKRGTVTFASYTDVNDTTQSLGIYLPVGYNKNASKPYKVIFVSHGGGGNENDWYSQGGINNIMDNLIAQGKTKDAIIVTMNNSVYQTADHSWDFPKISDNLFNNIMPYMERVYNVSKNVNDRAFCGLSMGSMTTCYMYMHHADKFGYFGAFSGGLAGGKYFDLSSPNLNKTVLMVGSGEEDIAYNTTDIGVPTFEKALNAKKIKYVAHFVPGAHDWFTWPQLFTYFADNVLWSKDKK